MDWAFVSTCLSVIHQCASAGPQWNALGAQCTDELNAYVDSINNPPPPLAEPTTTSTVKRV